MNYSMSVSNDDLLLKLHGDIDLYNVFEIKERLKEKLAESTFNLTIDLSEVNYIDSAGMGMIIEAKKITEEVGMIYKVTNIPGDIMSLFRKVALDQVLKNNLEVS